MTLFGNIILDYHEFGKLGSFCLRINGSQGGIERSNNDIKLTHTPVRNRLKAKTLKELTVARFNRKQLGSLRFTLQKV